MFNYCLDFFDPIIVDWAPVVIWGKVQDSAGNDLLDPENPNNLIDGATITFKGKTYTSSRELFNRSDRNPDTKAYLARIYGFMLVSDDDYNKDATGFSLIFGEIDGADDMDEEITITLSNGTKSVIHYHCSKHRTIPKVKCDRSWKFNGQPHDGRFFIIKV